MTPTRLVLIALTTLALLQTVYAANKKDGGATPTAKTPTSNPSGPVPIPYPRASSITCIIGGTGLRLPLELSIIAKRDT